MAALTGLFIADSYKALLKTIDNDVLGAAAKEIVDGYGNVSGVLFDTSGNVTINGNFRALDAILDSSGNAGTAGQVLTTTGTTTQWRSLSSVSGVTGSGTAGYLPLWSTNSALTNSIAIQSGATITIGGTLTATTKINTPILQLTGGIGTQGTLSWNADEETVDLVQNGATLQLGQETQIHVKNQTGATIPDGTPVRAAGTLGASGRILIAPMIANGTVEAKYFLGVTTETIANGDDGKVTTFGKIRGINTAAYTEGQTLWVSATTAGAFTTTRPVAPNLDLEVAIVINSHVNNGVIFVRSTVGHYLGTAHDVNISSVAENDLLVYKTNRWVNTKTIGDLSAANVTLSGYLRGPATFVIDPAAYGDETGLVQILGDLRVDGTTTTINSTTISVSDKNITLAKDAATAGDANGAGITIAGANATLTYLSATDDFTFNKVVNASGFIGDLTGNVTGTVSTLSNHDTDDLDEGLTNLYFTTARARDSFSAGTGVTINAGEISIGQSVGTTDDVTFGIVTASLSGNASTASALATARNIALDGSVTGNADFDGSGNITITTTTNHNHDDRYYTETEVGNFFSGTTAITGYNKTNWDAAYNAKINSGYFNSNNGDLVLTRQDDSTLEINFDDRYVIANTGNFKSNTYSVDSPTGTQRYLLLTTSGQTDQFFHITINRAYDYGDNDQTKQQIIYQRRLTNKNLRWRLDGDTTASQQVFIEIYAKANGDDEVWLVCTDFAKPQVYVEHDGFFWNGLTTADTPTGTLIKTTELTASNKPNWEEQVGLVKTTDLYSDNTYLRGSTFVLSTNGSSYDTLVYRDGTNPHVLYAGGGTSTQWNTAYSWGDHSGLYALISHTHPYLPLAGGTLTGTLNGVGANFTDPVTIYDADGAENPRLSVGREAAQSLNFGVEDRVALIYHVQDEGSGGHSLEFSINSPDPSKTFYWLGKQADGTSPVVFMTLDSSGISATGYNNTNWDTAFGWGDHSGLYSLLGHTHDDRYYTETESDNLFVNVSGDTMTGDLIINKSGGAVVRLQNNDLGNAANQPLGRIEWYNQDASLIGPNAAAIIEAQAGPTLGANANLLFKTFPGATEGADALTSMTLDYLGNLSVLGTISDTNGDSSEWSTAYGWGDHSGLYIRDDQNGTITTADDTRLTLTDSGDSSSLTLRADSTNSIYSNKSLNIYTEGADSVYFSTNGQSSQRAAFTSDGHFVLNSTTLGGGTKADIFVIENGGLVIDSSESTTARYIEFTTGGTQKMFLSAGGYLGIGESDPLDKLHIKNPAGDAGITLAGSSQTMRIDQNSIRTQTNSPINIFTNNTSGANSFFMHNDGRFGIGTTTPTAGTKLDVWGKIRATDDLILAQTNPRIDYDGGNTGYLRFVSTSTGSVQMSLFSNGNLGLGNTNNIYKLDVSGNGRFTSNLNVESYVSASGFLNTGNYFEKLLGTSFPDGQANLAVDIRLGNVSFWGYVEVEITGTFSNQNTTGKLTKVYAVGVNPSNNIYANESRVVDALGPIANNISLGSFEWDGAQSIYRIPISHIVSTGNNYTIKVKAFSHENFAASVFNNLSISPTYNRTAFARNYVHYNDRLGLGTTSPTARLTITDEDGVDSQLQVRNYTTLATGTFTNNYMVELRSAYATGSTGGALLVHTEESNDARPTMQVSFGGGIFTTFTNGKVGIGTTSPQRKLVVSNNGGNGVEIDPNQGGISEIISYNRSAGVYTPLYTLGTEIRTYGTEQNWYINNSFAMRLSSNGRLGIQNSNPSATLDVNGNAIFRVTDGATNTGAFTISNDLTGPNVASWSFSSSPIFLVTTETSANAHIAANQSTNDATGVVIRGYKSRGSAANNSSVANGDDILTIDAWPLHTAGPNIYKFGGGMTWYKDDGGGTANTYAPVSLRWTMSNSTTTTITAMTLRYNGNLGIGVDSPAQKLEVAGNVVADNLQLQLNGNINKIGSGSTLKIINSNAITEMFVNGSGNLGIGIQNNTALAKVHVGGTFTGGYTSDASVGPMLVHNSSTDTSTFGIKVKLDAGTFGAAMAFWQGSTLRGYIGISSGGTSYSTSSDYRLKENVVTLDNATERVMQLKPKRFNFIEGDGVVVDGFLAHEVQEVIPVAVQGEKDGVDHQGNPIYQGIDHSKLVPLLTASLQEALKRIETLEQKINQLTNNI